MGYVHLPQVAICAIAFVALVPGQAVAQSPAEAIAVVGPASVYFVQASTGVFSQPTGTDGLPLSNAAFAAADFTTQTNGNAAVTPGMTLYPKSFGIDCLFFPSKNLGVAVGALASFGINTPGTVGYPNIIMTIDQGTTWMAVTGTTAVASVAGLNAVASTSAPYPPVTAGDFTSVFFHDSKSGWAVGGNSISLAVTAVYNSPTALGSANPFPVGYVLRTTNGGTVWQNIPLLFTKVRADIAYRSGGQEAATLFSTSVPGILFSVQADSKGRCIYAVGSSITTMRWTGGAVTVQTGVSGTIMTSTTSGLSWVTRAGPVFYGATTAPGYSLFSVTVLSDDEAVAVGGSPTTPEGAGSSGVIVRTVNGGLSWAMCQYPGAGMPNVPALMGVAAQPKSDNVWAGGFVTAANTQATLAAGAEYYPVNYVAGSLGSPKVDGVIYTVLVSKDRGATFQAAIPSSFPSGFVQYSTNGVAPTILNNVFGIVWDNGKHGWIYGTKFILETHDGGNTWSYATPNDLIVGANAGAANAFASVPSGH